MVSQQMGRPFAIDDADIDVQFPVNLDATFTDEGVLRTALLDSGQHVANSDWFDRGYTELTSVGCFTVLFTGH